MQSWNINWLPAWNGTRDCITNLVVFVSVAKICVDRCQKEHFFWRKGTFLAYFTFGIASMQLQALTFSILLFSCSVVSNSLWPHGLQHARLLSFTVSWSLFKLRFIELMMLSNHLILCCSLLLPSIFPSIRIFSNESALCIRWPKYWSFSISPSNEYSGFISFRIDWFDLLALQGTLKSPLHSSKAFSIDDAIYS